MKTLVVFFIASLLATATIPVATQATTEILPTSIELIGDAKELSFTETGEPGFVYDDIFLPGETLERTLIIRNTKNVPFKLSFELERTSSVIPEFDLLSQFNISIYDNDTKEQLCSGLITTCDERQFYAILKPGDVRSLTMTVTFNKEAGNEYRNTTSQFEWIFDAIVETVPTTGEPTKPPIFTTGNPLVNTGLFALEIATLGVVLFTGGRYLIKQKKSK